MNGHTVTYTVTYVHNETETAKAGPPKSRFQREVAGCCSRGRSPTHRVGTSSADGIGKGLSRRPLPTTSRIAATMH